MYNPTRVHFGKGVTSKLSRTISSFGTKVLFVYGKGSIKKNGVYDIVMEQLESIRAEVYEYSGIRANPVIEDVDAAASLGRAKEVDVILAVGGGSVIDSAKIISITIPVDHSGWLFMNETMRPLRALPLVDILTLAATGSEMNRFAVVQNNETMEKIGFGHSLIYPKDSFLDPSFTITVPRDQTAYGIIDLIAHCLEGYFGEGEANLSDRFVYAIIKEAMEVGPLLMENLANYDLRARIMYAATNALNNLTFYGRKSGDWGVHSVGHAISLIYDTPHGATLSIAYLAWLRHFKNKSASRIRELGKNLFNVGDVDETINRLEAFFKSLGSPVRLKDLRLSGERRKREIIEIMTSNEVNGNHLKITSDDVHKIVDLMFSRN